ncbi:MAG: hypothetical protein ACRDNB_07595 [Gaiellaceae bacterium]
MSRTRKQILRFAVGTADGPRSPTWRLWVPRGKSDVYISSRRVANSVKVSLHEPGPSRFALTREHVEGPNPIAVPGDDPRRPIEWERERPRLPSAPMTRAVAILVPFEEVTERGYPESGEIVWTKPPAPGMCVEYDVFYSAAGLTVEGYPGARSMGTQLIGTVDLANGERVWVVAWEHPFEGLGRERFEQLRNARVEDAEGSRIENLGMLGFGIEDRVGVLTGVTLASEEET